MSDTVTVSLSEFLLARIAEDEACDPEWGFLLNVEHHDTRCDFIMAHSDYDPSCDCAGPRRWLAECEAKRRIMADYVDPETPDEEARGLNGAVSALAAVYADHPDYDESWRP